MVANLVVELAGKLSGKAMISADISEDDLKGAEIESIAARIRAHFGDSDLPRVVDRQLLEEIKEGIALEKAPVEIEIKEPTDFRPLAKEIEPVFSTKSIAPEKTSATVGDFTDYFNDRLRRLREMIERGRSGISIISSIDRITQYAEGRELSVVGMVYDKIITKKGNIMITMEDETGTVKVIFTKMEGKGAALFENARKIAPDSVIAVKGKLSSPFIIANQLLWPDIPIKNKKLANEAVSIAFTSDVHVGSKLFLEKQFRRFLEWINGNIELNKDIAGSIKYLFVSGDLVDGIGVYPNQDKELTIPDIYEQYSFFFDLISKIPEYVHVFVLPGNHDAVQRAEPQPILTDDLIKGFRQSNIHMVSNPSYVTVHGIKVLTYHGTSLDSVIRNVPGCNSAKPETAMVEMLKMRHLSPVYGENPIVPTKKDEMAITEVPDIMHMGHMHKNGYAEYHGTQIINSGTWQSRTIYQEKLGHFPTPALLPVYDAMRGNLSSVDFNR